MASESIPEADQAVMLISLQKELAEMKKAHKETTKKNEEEIKNLRKDYQEMKKLVEGGLSLGLTN